MEERAGGSTPLRVVCAGLAARDLRLIDIIFRYGDEQRVRFGRLPEGEGERAEIVVVNPFHPDGIRAIAQARSAPRHIPVVNVVPAASLARTNYTIQHERLGLELLPCLNRLIEREFGSARPGDGLFDQPSEVSGGGGSESGEVQTETMSPGPAPIDTAEPAVTVAQDETATGQADEHEAVAEAPVAETPVTEPPVVAMHHDTLLIGLNEPVTAQIEQTIALSGQLLVGCTSLADPTAAIETIRTEETKFVVMARRQRGISAFRLARRIRREFPDVVILVICEKTVLLDRLLAMLVGHVCLLSSRFGVRELTAAISKPLSQARARRRGSRQFDWRDAHSPWLNTGTGQ